LISTENHQNFLTQYPMSLTVPIEVLNHVTISTCLSSEGDPILHLDMNAMLNDYSSPQLQDSTSKTGITVTLKRFKSNDDDKGWSLRMFVSSPSTPKPVLASKGKNNFRVVHIQHQGRILTISFYSDRGQRYLGSKPIRELEDWIFRGRYSHHLIPEHDTQRISQLQWHWRSELHSGSGNFVIRRRHVLWKFGQP
jgi:hypothetical protein